MAIKLGVDTAIAAADAAMGLVNVVGAGTLVVYSGTEPADPAEAITDQVALVVFTLPTPAFLPAVDAVSGGRAVMDAVTPVSALEDGDAAWFRLIDGNDRVILQGSVSAPLGGGDLTISSAEIITGIEVSVVSLSYVQPK